MFVAPPSEITIGPSRGQFQEPSGTVSRTVANRLPRRTRAISWTRLVALRAAADRPPARHQPLGKPLASLRYPGFTAADRRRGPTRRAPRWRVDVPAKDPVGRPGHGPAERQVSSWQEQEAGTRKLPGRRVPGRAANQVPSKGGVSQIAHQGGSFVHRAPSKNAERLRMGGRDDHGPCLGHGNEADGAGKPG